MSLTCSVTFKSQVALCTCKNINGTALDDTWAVHQTRQTSDTIVVDQNKLEDTVQSICSEPQVLLITWQYNLTAQNRNNAIWSGCYQIKPIS